MAPVAVADHVQRVALAPPFSDLAADDEGPPQVVECFLEPAELTVGVADVVAGPAFTPAIADHLAMGQCVVEVPQGLVEVAKPSVRVAEVVLHPGFARLSPRCWVAARPKLCVVIQSVTCPCMLKKSHSTAGSNETAPPGRRARVGSSPRAHPGPAETHPAHTPVSSAAHGRGHEDSHTAGRPGSAPGPGGPNEPPTRSCPPRPGRQSPRSQRCPGRCRLVRCRFGRCDHRASASTRRGARRARQSRGSPGEAVAVRVRVPMSHPARSMCAPLSSGVRSDASAPVDHPPDRRSQAPDPFVPPLTSTETRSCHADFSCGPRLGAV